MIPDEWAPSRRLLLIGAAALALASCGKKADAPTSASSASAAPPGTLEWAAAGPWRSAADRLRDKALHPIETLEFFSLAPGQTVVEMWPGAGWWTEILGPYLTANKGKLYAATFETPNPDDPAAAPVVDAYRKMTAEKPDVYGAVSITAFGPNSGMLAPAGTADLVLFFDLDHWMAAGLAEKAFHDAFAALKPGGVLGVVQARADVGEEQDPVAADGYVQEAYVKQLATEAGLAFDKASEINANPSDPKTARRPLPFTQAVEPDRMTLRFQKK